MRYAQKSAPVHAAVSPSTLPNAENITRTVLDNGLVILVRENFSAPVVAIEGCIPCGSLHEGYLDPETWQRAAASLAVGDGDNEEAPTELPFDPLHGLAGFAASMLSRGSRGYTQDAFDAAVEDVGASLGASADAHLTNFGANSLAEDFGTMVDVLADILRFPVFPAEQVARMRKRRLVFLQERDHDSAHWAAMRFVEAIYGAAHPYGYPVSGTLESMANIDREALAAYHANFYTPQGAIIAVAGAVAADEVVARLSAAFADWRGPANPQNLPPRRPSTTGPNVRSFAQGKVQADLVLGVPAPGRAHPDHYAVRVANTILGQFGLMGRLGERLREEMGLAYYVTSQYDAGRGVGAWSAMMGVNPEHVAAAVQATAEEFDRLAQEPVGAEELDDAQAYMTGVLPVALESNSGVASTLLNMEWQQLGLDYLLRYPDLIYGVTTADVQRVAQTYLGSGARQLAVAGPPIPGALPLDWPAGAQERT